MPVLFDIHNCPTLEEIRYVLSTAVGEEEDSNPSPFVPRKPRSIAQISAPLVWRIGTRNTVEQATKMFRVSATRLKKMCRELGIAQWPRRHVESLEKLLEFPGLREDEKEYVRGVINTSFSHRFNLSNKNEYAIRRLQRKMYKHRNKIKTQYSISKESGSNDSSSGVSDSRISGDFDDVRPGAGHAYQERYNSA